MPAACRSRRLHLLDLTRIGCPRPLKRPPFFATVSSSFEASSGPRRASPPTRSLPFYPLATPLSLVTIGQAAGRLPLALVFRARPIAIPPIARAFGAASFGDVPRLRAPLPQTAVADLPSNGIRRAEERGPKRNG